MTKTEMAERLATIGDLACKIIHSKEDDPANPAALAHAIWGTASEVMGDLIDRLPLSDDKRNELLDRVNGGPGPA
jgi:hypothetical protein